MKQELAEDKNIPVRINPRSIVDVDLERGEEGSRFRREEKQRLDSKLREMGLVPADSRSMVENGRYSKDFVTELRTAKRYSSEKLRGTPLIETSYETINEGLGEISALNRRIEKEIKYEVMGIQKSPLRKIQYGIVSLFRGKRDERAEDILRVQQENISGILSDLKGASKKIDQYIHTLTVDVPIRTATTRNDAGIIAFVLKNLASVNRFYRNRQLLLRLPQYCPPSEIDPDLFR